MHIYLFFYLPRPSFLYLCQIDSYFEEHITVGRCNKILCRWLKNFESPWHIHISYIYIDFHCNLFYIWYLLYTFSKSVPMKLIRPFYQFRQHVSMYSFATLDVDLYTIFMNFPKCSCYNTMWKNIPSQNLILKQITIIVCLFKIVLNLFLEKLFYSTYICGFQNIFPCDIDIWANAYQSTLIIVVHTPLNKHIWIENGIRRRAGSLVCWL